MVEVHREIKETPRVIKWRLSVEVIHNLRTNLIKRMMEKMRKTLMRMMIMLVMMRTMKMRRAINMKITPRALLLHPILKAEIIKH